MKLAIVCFTVGVAGCAAEDRPATWSFVSTAIVEPACGTAGCHSQWSQVAGIVLDSREAGYHALTMPPDTYGPFIVAGDPAHSQLMFLLRGDEIRIMPPDAPLPTADIDLIAAWIQAGAKDNCCARSP